MSVLSQSFFALVRRHLMSFLLLSAWHDRENYMLIISLLFPYGLSKSLGGLEGGNLVLRNCDCGVLEDIAGSLGSSFLGDEATETSQIYILVVLK